MNYPLQEGESLSIIMTFLHISSVTSFLCYSSLTDNSQYKVLLGLQNHCLHHDTSKIFYKSNLTLQKKKKIMPLAQIMFNFDYTEWL